MKLTYFRVQKIKLDWLMNIKEMTVIKKIQFGSEYQKLDEMTNHRLRKDISNTCDREKDHFFLKISFE